VSERLRLTIRSPRSVVLDENVRSARVPTGTGQVGLRPREEPLLLAVEPGLIVYWVDDTPSFAATAGGLFESDRERAVLYTPFAVVGTREDEVLAALDATLSTPDSELTARRRLGELEERILHELRHGPHIARTGQDGG
jgi:F0F1-type ATP synthase epsilon subunit